MKVDAEGSRTEAGCLRFDCLRDTENENKFCTQQHPALLGPVRHRAATD
jgi:hypothetical protein